MYQGGLEIPPFSAQGVLHGHFPVPAAGAVEPDLAAFPGGLFALACLGFDQPAQGDGFLGVLEQHPWALTEAFGYFHEHRYRKVGIAAFDPGNVAPAQIYQFGKLLLADTQVSPVPAHRPRYRVFPIDPGHIVLLARRMTEPAGGLYI
jgi:hypothetical protein